MAIVNDLLRSNTEVQAAYTKMRQQGATNDEARAELARAIFGCLSEELQGLDDRFSEVVSALGRGQRVESLFSQALFEKFDTSNIEKLTKNAQG
jgi:hypothetical protein